MIKSFIRNLYFKFRKILFGRKPKALPLSKEDYPDTHLFRTSAHEVGHLLCAWHCATVTDIRGAFIHHSSHLKGITKFTISEHHYNWCSLIIMMGGIAAELAAYGNFMSGDCASDLEEARKRAKNIIERDNKQPPIKMQIYRSGPTLKFEKMFRSKPSKNEVAIMITGYRVAKQIVTSNAHQHFKLSEKLAKTRHLSYDDCVEICGARNPFAMFYKYKFFI